MKENLWQKAISTASSSAASLALLASAVLLSLGHISTDRPNRAAPKSDPTFVDPTATISTNVRIDHLVYIAPFAEIKAGSGPAKSVSIGNESNVQDNCTVAADAGAVTLGEQVIIAHGATVRGPASIGNTGHCPGPGPCPSFVGFNAEVDGAIIEKDAMVSSLARVGPGVTIPSGYRVLPGKNVTSNAEVAAKTARVTSDDREFMHGVVEVNVAFARQYTALAAQAPGNVQGINLNPATSFNPQSELPMLRGRRVKDPAFKDRIIGDLHMVDGVDQLRKVMAARTSLRADEGESFDVGEIVEMKDHVTFHALEHTHIRLGRNGRYGRASIVHGGPTPFDDYTITGDNIELGDLSVFFRARIGDNSRIGYKCLVQECDLPANTVIPDRTVRIKTETSRVEW
jgi:carbonic anhydrase/acetyltransferase-like protein (isoleucine patch superfamily)